MTLVTVGSVYEVPLIMERHNLDDVIMEKLKLKNGKRTDDSWARLVKVIKKEKKKVRIAVVGKYITMLDTYASMGEALKAASWKNNRDLELVWVDAEKVEKKDKETLELLHSAAGIVVPGGFGVRGTEGKIAAITYARENNIPYLGLCLGMQLATIEFARNVVGIKDATSEEFNPNAKNPVIHIMDSQKEVTDKGGTMRLGGWDCVLKKGTQIAKAYKATAIRERHRHRYEFNNEYREQLEAAGLVIGGTTPDGTLVETIELKDHPFFVAVQFHPEFTSRPQTGHPLFNAFIKAAAGK
jgi:CTP synthase